MKDPKKIMIVIVSVILLGAMVYLTYLLSTGDSIGIFNLRASNRQDEVDTFLQENNLLPTNPPAPTNDPSLLAYNSTSPTLTPRAGTTGSVTPSVSLSPMVSGTAPSGSPSVSPAGTKGGLTVILTPTPTEFIAVEVSSTPVVVTGLPVAGITDTVNAVLIGGGVLILLAFLL